jgi:hypothetical protein
LKLEHKPYEAKRTLANRFDIFLADARIIRLLPPYLGKAFYGKKRCVVFTVAKYLSSEDDHVFFGFCVCVIGLKLIVLYFVGTFFFIGASVETLVCMKLFKLCFVK